MSGDFGNLRSLQSLHLHNNLIVELPTGMWQLACLTEFTLDWLNYLDRKQVESLIFKSGNKSEKGKTPSRRKDKHELREIPLNVRLSKGEIGAKVFTELA